MPPTILLSLFASPQLHCLVLVLEVVVADVDVDVVRLGIDVVLVDATYKSKAYLIYIYLLCYFR